MANLRNLKNWNFTNIIIRKLLFMIIAILLFSFASEAAEYLSEELKVAHVGYENINTIIGAMFKNNTEIRSDAAGYKNVNVTVVMTERYSFELKCARQLSSEASKQILTMRERTNASVTDATSNALDLLILALGDANVSLRQSAARSLGEINDTRAVDPLIDALNDSSRSVQCEAVEALGKIGDKRATYPLILRLENWLLENKKYNYTIYSTYEHFGLIIALSLVRINDPNAIELLIQRTKSEDKDIRALAAAVLSAMNDSIAVDPLT